MTTDESGIDGDAVAQRPASAGVASAQRPAPQRPDDVEPGPGYRVAKGGVLHASSWCRECEEQTCDCLLFVMGRAKKLGPGTVVTGSYGTPISRRDKV